MFGVLKRQIERGQRPALERHRIPGHGGPDPEEIDGALDQVPVIRDRERASLAWLHAAAEPDPEVWAVLALEHGRRLTAVPSRRVHLQLVEQLERHPWPDRAAGGDLELGVGGERDLADAALRQVDVHDVPADLRRIGALAGALRVPRTSLARELGENLPILRPPAGGPAAEADRFDLVRVQGEHQGLGTLPPDMGVEQIGRVAVEQGAHQVGIERLRILVAQVLEAVPHPVAHLARRRLGAKGERPELGHRGVREQQQHIGEGRLERSLALVAGQPVLFDRRGRREGEGAGPAEESRHGPPTDRGQEVQLAALEREPGEVALQHEIADIGDAAGRRAQGHHFREAIGVGRGDGRALCPERGRRGKQQCRGQRDHERARTEQ